MAVRRLNNNLNVISSKLAFYRKKKGLSQAGLAEKLNLLGIFIHKNDINLIEANKRTVKDYELWGFVNALDITFEDLFTDIETTIESG